MAEEPHTTAMVRVKPSDAPVDPVRIGSMLGTLVPTRGKIGVLVIKRDSEIVYGFTADRCDESLQLSIERAFPSSYRVTRTDIQLPTPQIDSTSGVRYIGQGERPVDYLTPLAAAVGTNPSDPIDSKPIALHNVIKELVGEGATGIYQALITEPETLAEAADEYASRMKNSTPSWIGQLRRDQAEADENREPIRWTHPLYQRRIDRLQAQNLVPTLAVNARLLVSGPHSEQQCHAAANAFRSISTPFYEVTGRKQEDTTPLDLHSEMVDEKMIESLPTNIRGLRWFHDNASPCIITSDQSVLHFTVVDGSDTQPKLARALNQHDESDVPPRPPGEGDLKEYQ